MMIINDNDDKKEGEEDKMRDGISRKRSRTNI